MKKTTNRLGAIFALAAAAVVSAGGCNRDKGRVPAGPDTGGTAAKAVKVVQPERKSISRVVEQPGAVQADEETRLFAQVRGYVSKVHVDIGKKVRGPRYSSSGTEVEAGQILAEIAVPDLEDEAEHKRAVTRQTEAEVEQTRKALVSAEANIAAMEATVIEAKALYERWESESKRIAGLAQSGVIDVQTRDETRNQFKAAGARLAAADAAVRKAKADHAKSGADVRTAEARVNVAKAEVRRLESLLAYAKIRAPYDSVVTSRKVNTGDLVQPAAGKTDWLFTVARLDPVRVVVGVPEADAELVQEKATAKLTIKALGDTPLDATVTRISWALEPGARTLRAEIDLPNKDGRLRPGMYVYARIINRYPESWTLPAAAVVKQGDARVCFVIEGNKAVRTPVQVGRADVHLVEVIKIRKAADSWRDIDGTETIAASAVGLSDGQEVETGK